MDILKYRISGATLEWVSQYDCLTSNTGMLSPRALQYSLQLIPLVPLDATPLRYRASDYGNYWHGMCY